METLIYTSEEEIEFSQSYAPGTVVEVEIIKIIEPSQIITNFNTTFIGRLSLLDIAGNMPEAEVTFKSYVLGQSIKCVVLDIDFQNKIIILGQKYLLTERAGWKELNRETELPFRLIKKLHFYNLVQSDTGFFGLVPEETNFEDSNFEIFRIKDKLEDCGLLSLVLANNPNKLVEQNQLKQNLYRSIDVEFRSNRLFLDSMLAHHATVEEIQLIASGFELDALIFSKDIFLEQPLYLEFDRNDLAYSSYLENLVFPFFFPGQEFSKDKEGELLAKLGELKYWFKLNWRTDDRKKEQGIIRELLDFNLYNEDIGIFINVLRSPHREPRMVVKSINIGHDWAGTTERKKSFSRNGAFLFLSDILFLDPNTTIPIGLEQTQVIKYLELKTKCRDIAERLKTVSGEILRQEGKTLGIIDSFLEYQLDLLDSEKGDKVFIKEFKRVHGKNGEVTLKIPQIIEIDLDDEAIVGIRVKRPSLKENQDEEFVWFSDAIFKSTETGCEITFNKPIDVTSLRNGFNIEKKVSKKNLQIQREIIKDFLEKKIKLDHIESLLIKPERINAPRIAKIEFNNQDLRLAEAEQKDNTQVMAVKKAVGNKNIFLIQGPPGTGKTTVIAEIIEQLVALNQKILVAGQNHVAVDNVLQKMAKNTDMTLLRAGRPERVAQDLVRFCVDNLVEEYKTDFKKFIKNQSVLCSLLISLKQKKLEPQEVSEKYRIEVDKICSEYNGLAEWYRNKHLNLRFGLDELDANSIEKAGKVLERWAQNIQTEYEILLKPYLFNTVDVVFATCIGIRMDGMFKERKRKFDTVIIDEAGKASIAETLVAMEMGKKVILVGDQMQLPPYMDSTLIDVNNSSSFQNSQYGYKYQKEEVNHALKTSFFEFIINRIDDGNFPNTNLELLNYQHRMHPNIGEFVSSSFYQGKVQMGKMTHLNRWKLPVPFDKEIVFFDTSNSDNPTEEKDGQSFKNDTEAKSIADYIIPVLMDNQVSPLKIAIIAPYKAQVTNILKFMRRSPKCPAAQIDVSTLDSFQGKEFDIIIFSFTRSSNGKPKFMKVGFLDDARRLNVAFSRAKKKLILIGNSRYLKDPKAHFDSEIFNYTQLFNKLIQLSKNQDIGNFVHTADYLGGGRKVVSELQTGKWVSGKIESFEKNTKGIQFGSKVRIGSRTVLAPYREGTQIINKNLRSHKIGDVVEGCIVNPSNSKKPIFKILKKGWLEIMQKHETKESIKVKVVDIHFLGISVQTKYGINGVIMNSQFYKKQLPIIRSFIHLSVASFDLVSETIEFKLIK